MQQRWEALVKRCRADSFSLLVMCVALALIYGGAKLLALGGSSYYLLAGLAYVVLAVLAFLRKKLSIVLSILIFLATCAWAFYEVGQFSYWQLLPRLVVPAIILTLSLWVGAALPDTASGTRRAANRAGFAVFLALIATFIAAFFPTAGSPTRLQLVARQSRMQPLRPRTTGSSSGATLRERALPLHTNYPGKR